MKKDQVICQSAGNPPWMKLKKVQDRSFYYSERAGVDSVAFILLDVQNDKVGMIKEAKPPFNEREESNERMHFKTTAFGGSLFDMIDTEEYLLMSHSEQLEICIETVIKETEEESGYLVTEDNVMFANKVTFSAMSNEYTWLFAVLVNDDFKCKPKPQNETEAMAEVVWFDKDNEEELFFIGCGKLPAIILGLLGKKEEFEEKLNKFSKKY